MWIQRVSETMHGRPGLGLGIGLGCLAAASLMQVVSGTPLAYTMFYPAIMLVAFFSGRPVGYAAVIFSAAFAWYFYLPPGERADPSKASLIGITAFILMGVLITAVTGSLTKALVRLAARQRETERAREELKSLISEMSHRRRNELMLVDAIARSVTPQTPQGRVALREFSNRVRALANSGELLVREADGAPIDRLIENQIRPFCPPEKVRHEGPPLMLSSMAVRYLGMALHELCTNATKHGALSRDQGTVDLAWRLEGGEFRIVWTESGGPPVAATDSSGFGRKVLTELVPSALDGNASLAFEVTGLVWTMSAPANGVEAQPPSAA